MLLVRKKPTNRCFYYGNFSFSSDNCCKGWDYHLDRPVSAFLLTFPDPPFGPEKTCGQPDRLPADTLHVHLVPVLMMIPRLCKHITERGPDVGKER